MNFMEYIAVFGTCSIWHSRKGKNSVVFSSSIDVEKMSPLIVIIICYILGRHNIIYFRIDIGLCIDYVQVVKKSNYHGIPKL